jgi:hypothetical protein
MRFDLPLAKRAHALTMVVSMAALVLASVVCAVPASGAPYGVKKFDVKFVNADGSPAIQAGSHPFAMITTFVLSTHLNAESYEVPDQELKDLTIDQIPGFVGDPTATPYCSTSDFTTFDKEEDKDTSVKNSSCPNSTAVGMTEVRAGGTIEVRPVYNLVPPPGVAAELGFVVFSVPVTIEVEVKHKYPYNIRAVLVNVPQPVEFDYSKVEIWGNPGDPAHDPYRGFCLSEVGSLEEPVSQGDCSSGSSSVPFLTLPSACEGPLSTTYQTDSWQEPNVLVEGFSMTHDNAEPANPLGFIGCSRLGFNPTITAQPTSRAAESPTGMDFALNVHDEGLTNPDGLAQSDLKKAVVTLPEGMTANASLAEGLNVCGEAELARETAVSVPGDGCPQESKIGTVEVETPLLEEPLKGSLYIAKPYANPFKSLLALYFVLKDPKLGIIIRQPAEVIPNPVTGQLVTVVENIPQFPFSHFTLHFREGARSPLVTPPACGSYAAGAVLTPSSGSAPIATDSMFQIITGPDAGPCPAGGLPPFSPQASTGTLNNDAGAYSEFDLRIIRKDGEQELTRFSTIMPPGLTGNLSGIPFCSDAAIEASKAKTGAQENTQPSCPVASQIGHTLVGAGVGGTLAWAPGKLYLAGPYHGASLSVVSITSATVGPFDLGTVVIRFALRVNPVTAQVEIDSAGSDPIPHIIDGIVVNVREIHAYVDREKFILNPTNCNPMSITNTITGTGVNIADTTDDVPVTLNSPFQAADCANLNFKPNFTVSTSGKTSKANGASLNVKLAYPSAPQGTQANIHQVKVELPKQLPSRLTTLQKACTAAQFHTNPAGCPAASVIGHARAITPILPVPLEGPAYFVSNGGEAFPNLIMVLQGYGITIDLVGSTFISKAGITSSTFKTVPDQPVSSFELTLPQGPYSALAANGNLCSLTKTVTVKQKITLKTKGHKKTVTRNVKQTRPASLVLPTEFVGQNGAVTHQATIANVTGCAKAKPAKKKAKKANARKRK